MTSLRETFPALWHFFGAYLHQDWPDEHLSPDLAFQAFLSGEPTLASQVAAELTTVLDSDRDESALADLLRELGSFYIPSRVGVPIHQWLADLRAEASTSTTPRT